MKVWQIQEAKAKLSYLLQMAKKEPQAISRHGVLETVVIDIKEYEQLKKIEDNIVTFFVNSPLYGTELDIARDRSSMRDIEI